MSGSAGYAFISYSSKNQQMADSVRALLKDNHIACWMAPYDIPAGSKYAYVINNALENCSCLVLLLTEAAQESQFVEKEIERAVTYRKPIIPLMLEQVALNSGFRFYIGDSQIIALHEINPNDPAVKRAVGGIRKFTEPDDADDAGTGTGMENVPYVENPAEAGAVNVNGTGTGNAAGRSAAGADAFAGAGARSATNTGRGFGSTAGADTFAGAGARSAAITGRGFGSTAGADTFAGAGMRSAANTGAGPGGTAGADTFAETGSRSTADTGNRPGSAASETLDSAQAKKRSGIGNKIKRGLQLLTGTVFLLFPCIVKYTYSDSWYLPESVKDWLARFCGMDLRLYYLLVILVACIAVIHGRKIDIDYRRRKFSANNLAAEEFDCQPDLFVNKIVGLCGGKCIRAENPEECAGENEKEDDFCQYTYQKRLRNMEVASVSGDRVDYFAVRYRKYAPPLSVFFIGNDYSKNEAVTILTKQGFFFAEEKDHIVHFYRDDLHIRMAFVMWGFELVGIELCRGNVTSRMPEMVAEEMEDSLDAMFRETKEDFRKGKQEIKEEFRKMKEEMKEAPSGEEMSEEKLSGEERSGGEASEKAASGENVSEEGTSAPKAGSEAEKETVPEPAGQ